ncbi:mitochondrial inner membrane protease subunit 2-like [Corticium candelabrum]|uniref:mitochondrial inner membrane protease subunit 2-like n=1 Tax=Corticium candelabrum TaxID=121492 RepID=UPI002E267B95|nr:mitochondrial inner membrane protease subunit 2-like [Corticium candelabrum]
MAIRSVAICALYATPVLITFQDCCLTCSVVCGASMQPTLNPEKSARSFRDVVVLNMLRKWRRPVPQRGDIVAYISPRNPRRMIVKRVIGLPGDVIETLDYKEKRVTIPDGHCWVEGDNHGHSEDSNHYGPVALGLIVGHATHVVFPPTRMRKLSTQIPDGRTPLVTRYEHTLLA